MEGHPSLSTPVSPDEDGTDILTIYADHEVLTNPDLIQFNNEIRLPHGVAGWRPPYASTQNFHQLNRKTEVTGSQCSV
ncbi:hypothetical protein PAMP_001365 [Pampus punctatissimus]